MEGVMKEFLFSVMHSWKVTNKRLPYYSKVIPNLARLRRAVLRLKNNHQRIQSSGHGRGQLFYLFSNVFLLAPKCLADLFRLMRLHDLKGFYQLREQAMSPFGSSGWTEFEYISLLQSKFFVEGGKLYRKTLWEGPCPDFLPWIRHWVRSWNVS